MHGYPEAMRTKSCLTPAYTINFTTYLIQYNNKRFIFKVFETSTTSNFCKVWNKIDSDAMQSHTNDPRASTSQSISQSEIETLFIDMLEETL